MRLSKAHDNCRLLFEGALLILSYIFEFAGHEYNVEFFSTFEQVSEKYTRVKKYSEEISYSKDRFPDKGLDYNERIKLIHFSNLIKVSLHLVPNIKKGNRTHIIQLCARIVEGPDAKYISGGGMSPSTRRRVTVYEDESDVMPQPRPVRINEVVRILKSKDPVEEFNETIASSKLNVSSNDISTFHWQNGGIRVEAHEVASNNGNTVIRQTQILRNDVPIAINVNYTARQESPRNGKKDQTGGGGGASDQAASKSRNDEDVLSSEDSNVEIGGDDFNDILDFDTKSFCSDKDIELVSSETKMDEGDPLLLYSDPLLLYSSFLF